MSTVVADDNSTPTFNLRVSPSQNVDITSLIRDSWSVLTPFWPLKEFVSINPLQGLENIPIERALVTAAGLFQQEELPTQMEAVNRETIKWCQAFFDDGQASISMPQRELGLYRSWKRLAVWDEKLHQNQESKIQQLHDLPEEPEKTIIKYLSLLNIPQEDHQTFLTVALTTLPGWAAHVKYRNDFQHEHHSFKYPVGQADYLALRLTIMAMLWPGAAALVHWHKRYLDKLDKESTYINLIKQSESKYHDPILTKLPYHAPIPNQQKETADAQLVFCIDARSEQIRRMIESQGHYETFGFAGFFGLPVAFKDSLTEEIRLSCPVIVKPKHILTLNRDAPSNHKLVRLGHRQVACIKKMYQSLKYNFTTSLALVEILGVPAGLWMTLQNFFPRYSNKLSEKLKQSEHHHECLSKEVRNIPLEDQCTYAASTLKTMGLTSSFSPLVLFCAHGSKTQNNAFSSSLECGACGGRNGTANAKVICEILNSCEVRNHLRTLDINIPEETLFIAAEHNTTTNKIRLFPPCDISVEKLAQMKTLQNHLDLSTDLCNAKQIKAEKGAINPSCATKQAVFRSSDWAQTRPEWGLANNAAFIVGPRALTKKIDLNGRSFLHSYEWEHDCDGEILSSIFVGPLAVAQWINCQYLFSTLDNVAFGSGSKITKNITGKIGIVQGNGSDLMHGLPLQSVNRCDKTNYHSPCRLMCLVYAPTNTIEKCVREQSLLKTLIRNGWIRLYCLDPSQKQTYKLTRELLWEK